MMEAAQQPTGARGRMEESMKRLRHLPWALRLVWRAAAGWTVVSLALLLIQGLLPAVMVYLTKLLVDAVAGALGAGATWETAGPILLPAGLMALVMLLQQALSSVNGYVRLAQSELVQDYIKTRIHEQAGALDIAFFESTDYYNLLSQANSQASNTPLELITNVGAILQNAVTLFAIAALLIPYGAWLPGVLILTTLPAFYVILRHNRRYHSWWHDSTPLRRQTQYYDMMLTLDTPAAEVRMFGLNEYFKEAYRLVRARLRGEHLELVKHQNIARLGAGLIALAMTGLVMIWVVIRAMRGIYTLGDLALFYQAFNQGQGLLRELLNSIGQIHRNLLFLEYLHAYLGVERQVMDPADPVPAPADIREGIRFSDVTFQYPQSDRPALEDFNFYLPAGKLTAVVGANGAGKSTLVKLLCRFYDPQQGGVTIDGVNIRDMRVDDLRRLVTVLFQFPMRFQATALDNIRMGDLASNGGLDAVREAAHQAMVDDVLSSLPKGYETHLGKWFGYGTDLSGGQWQRVTLARAIFRQAPVIVLDEPTSAMDSWTENEWLDRFAEHVRGRTALVITHRFTTAMRADVIYVMDGGRVVEQGSHHSLLQQDGLYATSWRAQMQRHHQEENVAPIELPTSI
jgi:ATP-binding cassette, subfamily B, bacterial